MTVEALRENLKDARTNGASYMQARSLNVIAEVLVSILEIMENKDEADKTQNRPG